MSVRVKTYTTNVNKERSPEYLNSSFTQRETTVNGYTFHWGPNQVRNFLDDGVGIAHAAFQAASGVDAQQDIIPFNNARS